MRAKPLFYIILVFTAIAFFWWAYSLISMSIRNSNDTLKQLRSLVFEAEAQFLKYNDPLFYQDKSILHFKLHVHKIKVSQDLFAKIEEAYPQLNFEVVGGKLVIHPKPEEIQRVKQEKTQQTVMYVSEGLVFLLLLLFGFTWVFRSLNSMILVNHQQSNFLLSVTHELKTPIASIKLFLQTIQKRELPREQMMRLTENSIDDADRLNELVENVLLATRIEGRSYTYNFESVDFSSMLEEIVENYKRKFGQKFYFRPVIADDIFLEADEFSLKLVIYNLIENAMKYSQKGTEIVVALQKDTEHILFSVTDQGVGIAKNEIDNIFRKFYRVGNESTRSAKGTGLGLYIVQQVVENHHGSIEVKANEPKGTTFTIKL